MACLRSLLVALGAAALLAGCGGGPQAAPASPSSFSWRQFEGTTIRVLLNSNSLWLQVLASRFPRFEELTGIRLAVEAYPQPELWSLLETALAEPGRVDVFMTVPAVDGLRLRRAGRVQPLDGLLREPALAIPGYDWEDILPRFREAMVIEGATLGVPVMGGHLALLYRKDLFQAHRFPVPRTLDELEAAARYLHLKPMGPKQEPGVGLVGRGDGPTATSLFAALLHAMGGRWMDGGRRPAINSPQGLAALEYLGRLARYAPPDLARHGWQEASTLFSSGRAAIYLEDSSIFPILEQPSSSHVAGKVGYALFPAGPGGPGTTIAAHGLAIARQSLHPGAAWLFLQWASGPAMSRFALAFDVLAPRASAWQDRSARAEIPADLRESFLEAGRIGHPQTVPPMVAVTSAREAVGEAITAAIRGENIRSAADRATARLEEILRATETP